MSTSTMDSKVNSAVQALLLCKKKMKNEELLSYEDMKIFLQISAFKVAPGGIKQTIKLPMPAPFRESAEVCLFVKDLKRGIRVDHEKSLRHWKEYLEDKGVSRITEVMPLRQLKAEYSMYEAKRKLCDAYDVFLADVRIARLLPTLLGKHFVAKKKQAIAVNMEAADLGKEIDRALDSTYLHLYNSGDSSTVQVGTCGQTASELSSNISAAIQTLGEKFPGGLQNIRTLHLKLEKSPAIPIFVSKVSPNDVPVPAAPRRPGSGRDDVTGELSTCRADSDVTVTRHGDVIVTQKRPLSDDEEQTDEEELQRERDRKRGKRFSKTKKEAGKRPSKAEAVSDTKTEDENGEKVEDDESGDVSKDAPSGKKSKNSSGDKKQPASDEEGLSDDEEAVDSSDEEDRVLEAQERRFLQSMEAETTAAKKAEAVAKATEVAKAEAVAKATEVAKAVKKKKKTGGKSPTKEEKDEKNAKLAAKTGKKKVVEKADKVKAKFDQKQTPEKVNKVAKPRKKGKKETVLAQPSPAKVNTIKKKHNVIGKQKGSPAGTKKDYSKKTVKPVTKAKKVK